MDLEISLPLTIKEAELLEKVLDKYTDDNYNEIASIIQGRLVDILEENKGLNKLWN